MTADVDPAFVEQMLLLAEATGASLSETRLRAYALLLADLPIDDLRTAVYRCARQWEQKFQPADPEMRFPSVATLRAFAVVSESDAALVAWGKLQQAAEDIGAYASLEVEDEAVSAALHGAFGSWPAYCALAGNGPAMTSKRPEFLAAYRAAVLAPGYARGRVQRLPGLLEREGSYDASPRVWIGRLTAAGRVEHVRDQPRLPVVHDVNRLTSGDGEPI